MKYNSKKAAIFTWTTILLLFMTQGLFAQSAIPIKGESFLLDGVYYSNIDIEFVLNQEYLEALNSGLIFDVDLDFLVVNVRKRRFNREIGRLRQKYTLKYKA